MQCAECGATFVPKRSDQRFCCAQHKNNYHQRAFYQKEKEKRSDYLTASFDIDTLKEENERLKDENELLKNDNERLNKGRLDRDDYFKSIINRYRDIADKREAEIERLEDTIKKKDAEIERLKLEKRFLNKEAITNRQKFTTDHMERVYKNELRRKFPNDALMKEHIEPIRSFMADYIHAMVAQP
jgi:cell division protein FtsB